MHTMSQPAPAVVMATDDEVLAPNAAEERRDYEAHGAAINAMADTAGAQALDEFVTLEHSLASVRIALDDDDDADSSGAVSVLRRGLAVSPELRKGIRISLVFAAISAFGRLLVPVLIQQILDKGILPKSGFNAALTYSLCALGAALVVVVAWLQKLTYVRFLRAAEHALAELRVRVFKHIHRLSIAEHTDSRKGVLVARVT